MHYTVTQKPHPLSLKYKKINDGNKLLNSDSVFMFTDLL